MNLLILILKKTNKVFFILASIYFFFFINLKINEEIKIDQKPYINILFDRNKGQKINLNFKNIRFNRYKFIHFDIYSFKKNTAITFYFEDNKKNKTKKNTFILKKGKNILKQELYEFILEKNINFDKSKLRLSYSKDQMEIKKIYFSKISNLNYPTERFKKINLKQDVIITGQNLKYKQSKDKIDISIWEPFDNTTVQPRLYNTSINLLFNKDFGNKITCAIKSKFFGKIYYKSTGNLDNTSFDVIKNKTGFETFNFDKNEGNLLVQEYWRDISFYEQSKSFKNIKNILIIFNSKRIYGTGTEYKLRITDWGINNFEIKNCVAFY